MKAIQTDNSGEYRRQFEDFYKAQVIRIECKVPKTPKLNRLVENETDDDGESKEHIVTC